LLTPSIAAQSLFTEVHSHFRGPAPSGAHPIMCGPLRPVHPIPASQSWWNGTNFISRPDFPLPILCQHGKLLVATATDPCSPVKNTPALGHVWLPCPQAFPKHRGCLTNSRCRRGTPQLRRQLKVQLRSNDLSYHLRLLREPDQRSIEKWPGFGHLCRLLFPQQHTG